MASAMHLRLAHKAGDLTMDLTGALPGLEPATFHVSSLHGSGTSVTVTIALREFD